MYPWAKSVYAPAGCKAKCALNRNYVSTTTHATAMRRYHGTCTISSKAWWDEPSIDLRPQCRKIEIASSNAIWGGKYTGTLELPASNLRTPLWRGTPFSHVQRHVTGIRSKTDRVPKFSVKRTVDCYSVRLWADRAFIVVKELTAIERSSAKAGLLKLPTSRTYLLWKRPQILLQIIGTSRWSAMKLLYVSPLFVAILAMLTQPVSALQFGVGDGLAIALFVVLAVVALCAVLGYIARRQANSWTGTTFEHTTSK